MNQTEKRVFTALMAVAIATAFFIIPAPVDGSIASAITPNTENATAVAGSSLSITYSVDSTEYPYISGYAVLIEYDPSKLTISSSGCVDLSDASFTFNDSDGEITLSNHHTRTSGKTTANGLFKITATLNNGMTSSTAINVTGYNIVVMEGKDSANPVTTLCESDPEAVTGTIDPVSTVISPTSSGSETISGSLVISIDSASVRIGEDAEASIRVASGPRIGGAQITVKYDPDIISINESDIKLSKLNGSILNVDQTTGTIRAVWTSVENVDVTGILFSMTIHAKNTASAGSSAVSIDKTATSFKTWSGTSATDIKDITWSSAGGTITITAAGDNTSEMPDTANGSSIGAIASVLIIVTIGLFIVLKARSNRR
jgi:hypothetical protein